MRTEFHLMYCNFDHFDNARRIERSPRCANVFARHSLNDTVGKKGQVKIYFETTLL